MRRRTLFGLGSAIASASFAAATAYRQYRRDVREIESRLDCASQMAETRAGEIEYGRHGHGDAVLLIHGAGGGFDQGLLLGDALFGPGFNVIAPSRFGYLKTPVPEDGSPAAQADAHAALLDALRISDAVVVGVSAGAPSAIEMALRHPERTRALILIVPRAFAPGVEPVSAPAESAGLVRTVMAGADFAYWSLSRIARASVIRFLGVPAAVDEAAGPEERARITEIMRHVLPLSRRIAGLRNDACAEIGEWPLERILAPALIISADDDLYRTLPAARHTAERIAGADLLVLNSGGHLLVGKSETVRDAIRNFLQRKVATSRAAA